MLTTRTISHDEARTAAQRLINGAFRNGGDMPRFSIPADVERDDDLVVCAYIEQQRKAEATPRVE